MADVEKNHVSGPAYAPNHAPAGVAAAGASGLRKIADPSPLGLFSFASTTIILSFFNVQARGVTAPNAVVGMAIGVGGLTQLLAGMWEFACGNTFGATAFSSYGGFWISYAFIFFPGSGILEAYTGDTADQLGNALGFYLMAWFIFTSIMFMASLRSTAALASLFFFLSITFMLLMIGAFTAKETVNKAGGGFGILTAAIAYYCAASNLMTPSQSYLALPQYALPKRI